MPHGSVQAENASGAQSDILQSMGAGVGAAVGLNVGAEVGAGVGHTCMLHTRSESVGQAVPPYAAPVCTVMDRVWSPPPQLAEHGVHACSVARQSIGHGSVLQLSSCLRLGHARPPNCANATILRERDITPPPHHSVHVLQPLKMETSQSTGDGVGARVGAKVGEAVGTVVGALVGVIVGICVGATVGTAVGATVTSMHVCGLTELSQ